LGILPKLLLEGLQLVLGNTQLLPSSTASTGALHAVHIKYVFQTDSISGFVAQCQLA
jgi:hypothetical protein